MKKLFSILTAKRLKARIAAIIKEEQWNGLLPDSINPSELAETIVSRL